MSDQPRVHVWKQHFCITAETTGRIPPRSRSNAARRRRGTSAAVTPWQMEPQMVWWSDGALRCDGLQHLPLWSLGSGPGQRSCHGTLNGRLSTTTVNRGLIFIISLDWICFVIIVAWFLVECATLLSSAGQEEMFSSLVGEPKTPVALTLAPSCRRSWDAHNLHERSRRQTSDSIGCCTIRMDARRNAVKGKHVWIIPYVQYSLFRTAA